MLGANALHVLLLATLSLAAPSKRFLSHQVHETRDGAVLPPGWAKRSTPIDKKNTFVPVRINLKQQNVDRAHDILMEISDPDSHKYSEHLEPLEVANLFAPLDDTIDIVLDWLQDAGHAVKKDSHYSHTKGAVIVNLSVEQMEELFRTEYHAYEHRGSGKAHIACESYSLPTPVREHVDFVLPAINFDIKTPSRNDNGKNVKRAELGSLAPLNASNFHLGDQASEIPETDATDNCATAITLACLRKLYNIHYTPRRGRTSYGIVEYGTQSYLPSDLDLFANTYNPPAKGYRPTLLSADGGSISTVPNNNLNLESNLDLEYAIGLTWPNGVSLYQVGDRVEGASFNQFLDAVDGTYCHDDPAVDAPYPDPKLGGYKGPLTCGKYRATKVISTSYTYTETTLSKAYATRQCNEYLKLGLLGVTFLYSSGDFGVAGNQGHCMNANHQDVSSGGTVFNPTFPGSCPYVLAVGATQVPVGGSASGREVAASFSAGGFSNYFSLPSYQASAVHTYYQNHNPGYGSNRYNNNQKARGYPDVSANGLNYLVAINGLFYYVWGTSASAPVFGSIITLINDARAARGKKSVGFVNPTFYKYPGYFNDITSGNNPGCGTQGFSAVRGWDPVTGLGTPNTARLISLFETLP